MLPEPDLAVQAELWEIVEKQGIEPLLQELERTSPEDAQRVQRNPAASCGLWRFCAVPAFLPPRFPGVRPGFVTKN